MQLSDSLFWDTPLENIDWDEHAQFVIQRVLMRGKFKDWIEAKNYYGMEKIKVAAQNARHLDKLTLHFCSAIFGLPKESFRCYDMMPSIRQLWDF